MVWRQNTLPIYTMVVGIDTRSSALGNPLQPEILSMASDMNGGTAKLLMYLLDNLTGMVYTLHTIM